MQDFKKDLLQRGRPHQRRPSHRLSWRSSRLLSRQVSVPETLGHAWPAGIFAAKTSPHPAISIVCKVSYKFLFSEATIINLVVETYAGVF